MPRRSTTNAVSKELLEDLLRLARSGESLPCDCLRAVQAHKVRKYEVDGATLSFPLLGEFKYREKSSWVSVCPGEILVIPNARSIDIEYIPDGKRREFVALSVVLTDEQLEAARLLLAVSPPPDTGNVKAVSVETLLEPLSRWTLAMNRAQRVLSLHAMVEVVLRLYEDGHSGLLHPQSPSLAMSVRRLVSQNPAHGWSSLEIEQLLGISGPTLRRRMAEDSTTLRAVIADARIAEALRLLMTSRLPVKTVAARVGYNSIASFSRQFADRYGAEPSQFR